MNRNLFIKNINILNIILFLIVCFLYLNFFEPLSASKVSIHLPSPKQSAVADLPKLTELPAYSSADFLIIGDMNLFHPERRIPTEVKNTPTEQKPQIILYGTIVSDGLRIAYLEEKRAGQSVTDAMGRNKRQRAMKLGQSINGYVLKSIALDSVMFAKGDDKIIVSLQDGKIGSRKAMARKARLYPAQRTPAANRTFLPFNRPASPAQAARNNISPSPQTPLKLNLRRPVH